MRISGGKAMSKKIMAMLIVLLVGLLLSGLGERGGLSLAQEGSGSSPQAAVTPLLQYQGRLSDPATGDPVADGVYEISFRLYNVDAGGAPLWTETEDVPVQAGIFSNMLGDSTPLGMALFNGQALWLGIKVGADPEAAPRQPVLPVAYALSLVPGAVVGGPVQVAGNLDVTGSLTGAHASNPSAHHVRYSDTEAWNAVLARDGSGSGLNADYLDGSSAEAFAAASHTHDERYYTESESNANFVNVSGDAMSGSLTVPQVRYSSPRTHYYSVGGEDFMPWNNVDYSNSGGCGGASVLTTTGGAALVAGVHLPHGAVVTRFTVYFYDTSVRDLTATLYGQYLSSCGFFPLAELSSSGTGGYYSVVDTTISYATIDNTSSAYHVKVYGNPWDQYSLAIKGAVIQYTIAEAP
jgi:hypothetical protein